MAGFKAWAVYSKNFGRLYKTKPFRLRVDLWYTARDGSRFMVPAGFLTDLGSIPRLLWNILPRDKYPSSFILHDYLCEQDWMPRKDADKILLEALRFNGAGYFEAHAIYYFVRLYVRAIKPIQTTSHNLIKTISKNA